MSKCISSHGEYSEHEVKDGFICEWCGAFDEQAALDRIETLEAERDGWASRMMEFATAQQRIKELEAAREAFEAEAVESAMRIHRGRIKQAEARLARLTDDVVAILDGIDREEPDGWWETSTGAEFGAGRLAAIRAVAADESVEGF